jgi:hypothetical protein
MHSDEKEKKMIKMQGQKKNSISQRKANGEALLYSKRYMYNIIKK